MQSASLKSKVKGTKDINCLPTSTSLRGWGRGVDKYFTCRGNLTNSWVETENGLSPNESCCCAHHGRSLPVSCGSGGRQEPCPLLARDYWHLFAHKSLAGIEGHGPIPTVGRPWPRFTNTHHDTYKHTNWAASMQLRGTNLRPQEMAGCGPSPCSTQANGQPALGAAHGGQCTG